MNTHPTYQGFVDETYNLLFDDYGVLRAQRLTEERLKDAYESGISARKFVLSFANEIGLTKIPRAVR